MTAIPPPEAFAHARLASTLAPMAGFMPLDQRSRHRPLQHQAPCLGTSFSLSHEPASRSVGTTVERWRSREKPIGMEPAIQPMEGQGARRRDRAALVTALLIIGMMAVRGGLGW